MAYRVEVGRKADGQRCALDRAIGASVERKVRWLAENADQIVIAVSLGCPKTWRDLAGLPRIRIDDYRILYRMYPEEQLIRIYRIQHRSEVYRDL